MDVRLRSIKAAYGVKSDGKFEFRKKPTQENFATMEKDAQNVYRAAFGPNVMTPNQRDLASSEGSKWAKSYMEKLFAEYPGMRQGHASHSPEARISSVQDEIDAKLKELLHLGLLLGQEGHKYARKFIRLPSFKRKHEQVVQDLEGKISVVKAQIVELKRK